jgi:hypothetical protein
MKYDSLLYEIGLIFLIFAVSYTGVIIYKLTFIIKEKKAIWVIPFLSVVMLFIALISHIYANFFVIPELEKTIGLLSAQSMKQQENFKLITMAINNIKNTLLLLKTFSFTCFLLASLFLTFTTSIYIKWITK